MSNIEALERLVGSRILQVKLNCDGCGIPYEAVITTADGEVVEIFSDPNGVLYVEVKDAH